MEEMTREEYEELMELMSQMEDDEDDDSLAIEFQKNVEYYMSKGLSRREAESYAYGLI